MYKALFTAEDFSSLLTTPTNGEPAWVVGGRVKHRWQRKRAVKHRESAILRQRAQAPVNHHCIAPPTKPRAPSAIYQPSTALQVLETMLLKNRSRLLEKPFFSAS